MKAKKKLEKEFEKRDQDIQKMGKQLQSMQDQLEKNGPTMADSDRRNKEREFNDLNRDFERKQREFREDLYFRVSAFRLTIPALADRPGDILPLAALFLVKHSPGTQPPVMSREAGEALLAYRWPGNVRELQNVVQRALVLCNSDIITEAELMFDDTDEQPSTPPASLPFSVATQFSPRHLHST